MPGPLYIAGLVFVALVSIAVAAFAWRTYKPMTPDELRRYAEERDNAFFQGSVDPLPNRFDRAWSAGGTTLVLLLILVLGILQALHVK